MLRREHVPDEQNDGNENEKDDDDEDYKDPLWEEYAFGDKQVFYHNTDNDKYVFVFSFSFVCQIWRISMEGGSWGCFRRSSNHDWCHE